MGKVVVWNTTVVIELGAAAVVVAPAAEPADCDDRESVTTPPLTVLTIVTPLAFVVVSRVFERLTGPGPTETGETTVVVEAMTGTVLVIATTTVEDAGGTPRVVDEGGGTGVEGVTAVDGAEGEAGIPLVGTTTMTEVLVVSTTVTTDVTVATGIELLLSCRLASETMLVARGALSRCTASTAVRSSGKTPCLNFPSEKSCRAA